MAKIFNIAGRCSPESHYMVEPLRGYYKIISRLIRENQYFLIHAPRQTGKTTLLHALVRQLNEEAECLAVAFSVENARFSSVSVAEANTLHINALYKTAKYFLPSESLPPEPSEFSATQDALFNYLNEWASRLAKPLVIFIDEADSLNEDALVSLLSQLRNGFQIRPNQFPASVALVGLRDIREYKIRVRGQANSFGAGSPFNIKTRSLLLPFFSKKEVDFLLEQHTKETGQKFPSKIRAKIFEYSGGQPWLTNALAYEIVQEILDADFNQKITLAHVEKAKEQIIARRETHLDSLLEKLQENRVKFLVTAIINGNPPNFDEYDDAILYCRDIGIIKAEKPVQFSSPIYREIITRTMNSNFSDGFNQDLVKTAFYINEGGNLDMDKILEAFRDFYRLHSESWLERFQYKEAGHQLLLMAFLQRVVNGGGRIEREMAIGNGRTDIAVFWKKQVVAIEIKIKQHLESRTEGLNQTAAYMDKLGLKHGYLVLFDKRPSSEYPWAKRLKWNKHDHLGKEITIIEL